MTMASDGKGCCRPRSSDLVSLRHPGYVSRYFSASRSRSVSALASASALCLPSLS